jgi:hypothetical protein
MLTRRPFLSRRPTPPSNPKPEDRFHAVVFIYDQNFYSHLSLELQNPNGTIITSLCPYPESHFTGPQINTELGVDPDDDVLINRLRQIHAMAQDALDSGLAFEDRKNEVQQYGPGSRSIRIPLTKEEASRLEKNIMDIKRAAENNLLRYSIISDGNKVHCATAIRNVVCDATGTPQPQPETSLLRNFLQNLSSACIGTLEKLSQKRTPPTAPTTPTFSYRKPLTKPLAVRPPAVRPSAPLFRGGIQNAPLVSKLTTTTMLGIGFGMRAVSRHLQTPSSNTSSTPTFK